MNHFVSFLVHSETYNSSGSHDVGNLNELKKKRIAVKLGLSFPEAKLCW